MDEVECIGSRWTFYPLRKDWSNASPFAQTHLFIGYDDIEKCFENVMEAATGLQGSPLLNGVDWPLADIISTKDGLKQYHFYGLPKRAHNT